MYSVPQNQINDKVLADEWSQLKTTVWGELKQESAIALKKLLELTMEIEVQDLIGSRRWQHNNRRSNYRNGY